MTTSRITPTAKPTKHEPPPGYTPSRLRKLTPAVPAPILAVANGSARNGAVKSPATLGPTDRPSPPRSEEIENKPEIKTNDRQLRDVSADCLRALACSNTPPHLFARAGEPVHITADESGRKKINRVSAAFLTGALTRSADFFNVSEKGARTRVNPPSMAVADLLSRPINEWDLPPLVAVTETPLLRPDGSVVDVPGYDAETRMVYAPAPGLTIPPMSTRPTKRDAKLEADVIKEAIGEFPWADDASLANTLGLLLTTAVRSVIRGCVPVSLLDAPQQGTGKSLLVEVIARISAGSSAALRAAPRRDDDEWRKGITAAIYAGNQLTIFDNMEDVLRSPALAAAVTSETWQDRILGRTETITLPQRTMFIVTGNNLSVGGDLARRCYWIRLDAKSSRPWLGRKFRHADLKGWVAQNRGKLLAALLTMASAWYAAGCPPAKTPVLGSFEEWSRIIGGILSYVGIEGFLGNLENLYKHGDQAESQWEVFLQTLHEHFVDRSFTVQQLLSGDPLHVGIFNFPDELEAAAAKGNTRGIGWALLRKIDRRFGEQGLHLTRGDDDRTGVATWRVDSNESPQ